MKSILFLFGLHTRKLRTEKGFSQEDFAHHIGMDRTYYSSVENGKRNISLINIYKIAKGLDMPICKLFEGIEEE